MKTKTRSIYEQLCVECDGFIRAYRDDLIKHDKAEIEENPGVPFLHTTREMGTTMTFLTPAEDYPAPGEKVPYVFGTADRWHILKEKRGAVDWYRRNIPDALWHYFDGKELRRITLDEADEIVSDYIDGVKYVWRVVQNSLNLQ